MGGLSLKLDIVQERNFEHNINWLKRWCNDKFAFKDHRARAEKQADEPPSLILPFSTSLFLILITLWTETATKRLITSLVNFWKGNNSTFDEWLRLLIKPLAILASCSHCISHCIYVFQLTLYFTLYLCISAKFMFLLSSLVQIRAAAGMIHEHRHDERPQNASKWISIDLAIKKFCNMHKPCEVFHPFMYLLLIWPCSSRVTLSLDFHLPWLFPGLREIPLTTWPGISVEISTIRLSLWKGKTFMVAQTIQIQWLLLTFLFLWLSEKYQRSVNEIVNDSFPG